MKSGRNHLNDPSGRRFFIKKSFLGASAFAVAGFLPIGCSHSPPSTDFPDGMDYFDAGETYLLSHIIRRIVPLSHDDNDTLRDVLIRLDRFFIDSPPEDQREFGRLLTVFNHPAFVFIFGGSFKSFDRMSDKEKDEYLRGWMISSLGFRRTAFQALKKLIMSMYYTRDESWNAIGYAGPLV